MPPGEVFRELTSAPREVHRRLDEDRVERWHGAVTEAQLRAATSAPGVRPKYEFHFRAEDVRRFVAIEAGQEGGRVTVLVEEHARACH